MAWCEGSGVEYMLGLARNSRLEKIPHEDLVDAESCMQRRERRQGYIGTFCINPSGENEVV